MQLDQLVAGAQAIAAVARRINALRATRYPGYAPISLLDVGGGFPADYASDLGTAGPISSISIADYARSLEASIPHLDEFTLVTEFGRGLIAKACYLLARVENVKYGGGHQVVITHCGSDLCVWAALSEEELMRHRVSFLDSRGYVRRLCENAAIASRQPAHIVPEAADVLEGHPAAFCTEMEVCGPLCFSHDICAFGRQPLPGIERGDIVLIHDAGAYTLSTWTSFNSRPVRASTSSMTVRCLSKCVLRRRRRCWVSGERSRRDWCETCRN
eukprot:gnl/Ergobibamus_cyprinoides/331.p1 GENE.gnl/Ergobibamus_cyprinoides/331~~gnl/Ergobibamus_cyprinoides/331.p1  ORF type:complete len:272 (+),score=43.26 gnl/Ergobibamus_cyprinoides/331:562-1377(+)